MISGNSIFTKFWYSHNNFPTYKKIPLIGYKKGISGSVIGGLNVGINKFISKDNINAAVKVVEFMTSMEIQKKLIMEYRSITAIQSLYKDEEVCKVVDCDLLNSIQPVARPCKEKYDDYSFQFREYMKEFIYGNATAEEALNNIINIEKIYTISIDPSISNEGFIIFILLIIIIIAVISSLIFLFINKFNLLFKILDTNLWMIYFTGLIVTFGYILTYYDDITVFKCKIRIILLSFGYTLIFTPILFSLISNFPDLNKYFLWIKNNKYKFILMVTTLDLLLNLLLYTFFSFTIQIRMNVNRKNYNHCQFENNFMEIIIIILLITEKMIILFSILLFLFMEWNMTKIKKNIKLISSAIYMDILLFILFIVSCSINIKNFLYKFMIRSVITILAVLSNYFFIYLSNIFLLLIKKEEEINLYDIKEVSTLSSKLTSKNSTSKSQSHKSYLGSSISKIINYHYNTGDNEVNNVNNEISQKSYTFN